MRKLLFIVVGLIPLITIGQKLNMTSLESIKPRNIGPAGMAGRITAIDVVITNPDIIYVGAASGGVWKSTSGGTTFEPIFENQTTSSIGAIAIQQSNPSVVWVGTGEGNPRNSLNGGDGIYKSLDGGKNWVKIGLEKTRHIHRIIIHPDNPDVVWVGAIGSPWGEHPERGVFKTTDGGKTWRKVLFTNEKSGVADLIIDSKNPNKLIAAIWEHKRDPWFFTSGGSGSGLYISYDGGETWTKKTSKDGLPEGDLGRIGLAIAESDPSIVYALIESKKNGLYKSTDGGFTWKLINEKSDIGNRPFYYSDIFVDPKNENRVYSVFTYVNVSEDGGKNFEMLMPAYNTSRGVHPDHHAWWIHPQNPNYILDGNDGGLNISRDRGKTWNFVQTLPVAQYYHINVDNEMPYNVYGGMQDNGSWVGPAYVWRTQGIRNSYWQEISFGDGFDVLPDPTNSRYGISTSQGGSAGIYDRATGYFESIRPTHPELNVELRFNWNTGMNRDPFEPKTIYFGSQFVHKSTDGGHNWMIISPDLTTNDPAKQKQDDTGGLSMDATGAENHCTIIVMEPSPISKDEIWVGTDDGNVQITRDGGKTWKNVAANIKDLPKNAWINQIKPSNKNRGEALLVANDYRRFNYTPYAYRTKDYGTTWERIVDQNDVISYTLSIVEDPIEKNLLFLGTDDGLYISIDGGINWTKYTNGMPTTNVMDMVIHPTEHDLILGTFGRSAYVLDDIRPLRKIASMGINATLSNTLSIYTPPAAYLAEDQQPTGSRFGADAMYNAENRTMNALISYSINRPENPAAVVSTNTKKGKSSPADTTRIKPEIKYDSIKLEVLNINNEVIRTLSQKAPEKNGMYRMEWSLDEKGIPSMSRNKSSQSGEPGGVKVLPGTYMLRMSFGDQTDSTKIEVKADPRIPFALDDQKAKYDYLKGLQSEMQRAIDAVKRIQESKKIAETYSKQLSEKNDLYKDQINLCKTTTDSLEALLDIFFGKQDDRQGITAQKSNHLSGYYFNAYRYASNATHAPTANEIQLRAKFQEELDQSIVKVNAYFETRWPVFRAEIEKIDLSPFKDLDKLK